MVESRLEVSQGQRGAQCMVWDFSAKMQFSLICVNVALYVSSVTDMLSKTSVQPSL